MRDFFRKRIGSLAMSATLWMENGALMVDASGRRFFAKRALANPRRRRGMLFLHEHADIVHGRVPGESQRERRDANAKR